MSKKSEFVLWAKATCGYCGFAILADDKEPYLYHLKCLTCKREGCVEYMPSGRGCEYPECENNGDER